MNHRKSLRKFGRDAAHRRAMLRNLATSLILHNRIETTLHKAKDLRRVADGLVTLGKKNNLHARRQAMSYLFAINRCEDGNKEKLTAVHRLFEEIAPRYVDRQGGYTRVVRTRRRDGDKAQMAIIEFVEEQVAKKAPRRRRRVSKKAEDKAPVAEAQAGEAQAEKTEQPAETANE
jgi:large subunit ribosomal protein L17